MAGACFPRARVGGPAILSAERRGKRRRRSSSRRVVVTECDLEPPAKLQARGPSASATSSGPAVHPVAVRATFCSSRADQRLLQWRVAALRKVDGVKRVEQLEQQRESIQTTTLVIGPFLLRRGGLAGTPLPQFSAAATALSEVAAALLLSYACLATPLHQAPEITFDDSDAALDLLKAELDALAGPAARSSVAAEGADGSEEERRQAIIDTMRAIEIMVSDSTPLSELHRRVHQTAVAVLSQVECEAVVAAAECHAASHGWSTRRHVAYPTHDLPVSVLGSVGTSLTSKVESALLPELAAQFGLNAARLKIQDMFVAKYSAAKGGLKELEAHEDGSEFSFVLALNARTAYAGGGTKFLRMKGKPVLRPDQGFASLFAGKNRHCGLAISTGVRYVLAGFLAYSGDERILDCAHGASADVGVDIAPRRREVKRVAR